MAVLHTIRTRGKILIGVVGLALFAFIAEEFVRALSYHQTENRQRIGEVYGKSINVHEFGALVEEYTSVVRFTSGNNSLTDEQLSMIRDQVWQSYVNQQLIQHEAEKLGLTVTDAEVRDIIEQGKHPLLAQTPFRNQQGAFDKNALTQFLGQYNEVLNNPSIPAESKESYRDLYNYWTFIEKTIKQQALANKFQTLLAGAMLGNPVAAKMNFDARNTESEIIMAALPYSIVKDEEVAVEDADLKAKYAEMKELFSTTEETRDIRYINVTVRASEADKDALRAEMNTYATALAEGSNPAKVVREAASKVAYSSLPLSRKAFPADIARVLDTLAVGQQVGPFNVVTDNTSNIVRLIAKAQMPDSVEVRQIAVPAASIEEASLRADSIMGVIAKGEPFDSIAKKFDQPATLTWISSNQYEGQMLDDNNRKFIETITTTEKGKVSKIVLDGQGVIVIEITDRRNFIDKYTAAVVKRTIDFSKDTYGKAYNDFSAFLAGNPTAEKIEENAKEAGYTVLSSKNISSASHRVVNVARTTEALRWIFNEDTKKGDVSPLYECGDNDHMLVVILDNVNKKGYTAWDNEQVKNFLTTEVQREKKAKILSERMAGKSLAEVAKLEGAVSDTVRHITFSSPTFVSKVGASEPALSGAVSRTAKGDFKSPIQGNAAVYAYQVIDQKTNSAEFDEKKELTQLSQTVMRDITSFSSELYKAANVVDKRYLFY